MIKFFIKRGRKLKNKLFIDSSFFIALVDKSDRYHDKAKECFKRLAEEKNLFYTTNFILSETITRLKLRVNHKTAKEFGENFRKSRLINLYWIDQNIEEKGWQLFLKYADKDFSYVDVLSFVFMLENKITKALSFDKHFRQIGFETLPIY